MSRGPVCIRRNLPSRLVGMPDRRHAEYPGIVATELTRAFITGQEASADGIRGIAHHQHNKALCGSGGSKWTLTDAAFDTEAGILFYLFDLSLCLLVRFCAMGTFMDTKNILWITH